ncbi:MAG: sulfur carrier protein ThiS [Deltaproteobacteria bacterium]
MTAEENQATEAGGLKFILNGFPEEMKGCRLTVQELLDRTQEDDPAVIVEINGRFIYRKDFSDVVIQDGDRVELVHPSFGG